MPESLGNTLKRIRESKHLSIEEISDKTRIPKRIISAIEEDRLHDISSPFYAKNFVKSYSRFLNAQEEKLVKAYLSETKKKEEPIAVVKSQVTPWDLFVKYKRHAVVTVFILISTWFVFFSFFQMRRFARHMSAKHSAKVAERRVAREQSEAARAIQRLTQEEAKPKAVEKKEDIELEITARLNTWIQVISDGELLFTGILRKNQGDVWQAKKEIRLELGNAGGVTATLNEKKLAPLGRKGEKKLVVITKEGVKF